MKFDQSFICDDILTLMPFSINTEKKKKKKSQGFQQVGAGPGVKVRVAWNWGLWNM